MRHTVYDAGALIAADRGDRTFWAEHRVRLEMGVVPVVPSVVIAQVSRSTRQVGLRRALRGCHVIGLTEDGAHAIGRLLGLSTTADVADAAVVLAARSGGQIATGDVDDIAHLVAAANLAEVAILRC